MTLIREFKQSATATSTTAVVDAVSWVEYVSYLAKFQGRFLLTFFRYNLSTTEFNGGQVRKRPI